MQVFGSGGSGGAGWASAGFAAGCAAPFSAAGGFGSGKLIGTASSVAGKLISSGGTIGCKSGFGLPEASSTRSGDGLRPGGGSGAEYNSTATFFARPERFTSSRR